MNERNIDLVIFDLDGTLITKQSQKLFLDYLINNKKTTNLKVLPIKFWFVLNWLGIINDPNKVFEYALVVFKEFKYNDLVNLTTDFVNNYLFEYLNHEVLKSLNDHFRKKDEVILISSAFNILVERVAKKLGIDFVISTKIVHDRNKIKSLEKIVYGEDKKNLFLKKYGQKISNYRDIFVYSDSFSDLPIFSVATKAIAVKPDRKLRKIARRNNWIIFN